jgi:hypothetical protein
MLEKRWIPRIIKLDGVNGGLVHFIAEAEPKDLDLGMRMEAVFKDQREGNIPDIKYFRPAKM